MKIDYKKIGKGIYDMMPEDDKILISFGMINKIYHDMLENQLRIVIADKHKHLMIC